MFNSAFIRHKVIKSQLI